MGDSGRIHQGQAIIYGEGSEADRAGSAESRICGACVPRWKSNFFRKINRKPNLTLSYKQPSLVGVKIS